MEELNQNKTGTGLKIVLSQHNFQAYADVVEDEMKSGQLRLIETAGHFKGLEPFVKQFKAAGAFIIHKCTSVRHARSAERIGVRVATKIFKGIGVALFKEFI